jgi:prepilin-type N-terminal cleavage/methylation domain-containing protein
MPQLSNKFGPRVFRRSFPRRGFTLLEVSLALVVISVGVTSVVQLLASGTFSNIDSNDTNTAINLANNIHELTFNLHFTSPTNPGHWGPETGETLATYDDMDDFDGQVFSPPIDARRQTLNMFAGWSQTVSVQSVDPNMLTLVVPQATSPVERITVTVKRGSTIVYVESWNVVATY